MMVARWCVLVTRLTFVVSLLAPPALWAKTPLLVESASPERQRSSYIAKGEKAMVATAHPAASEAGLAMLKDGGNAIDAAVAASFAISVVRPQSTGLGGGGFLLSYAAKSGETLVYDFRERAPAKATRDMFLDSKGNPKSVRIGKVTIPDASVNGHLAVATPGLVAGLLKAHADQGKLPLRKVMAPAIKLARKGFPVYQGLAKAIAERAEVLRHYPGSKALFFHDDKPLAIGEILVQKDLATTLQLIVAKREAGFYRGKVGALIVAEMRRGGGILTRADLRSYKVKMREPVIGEYRGHRIVSMPPPSSGGVHIVQILNMLAGDDYGALGFATTASVHLLTEAMRRAFADRAEYLGDPDFVKVPLKGLTAPAYAKALRATIDLKKASPSSSVKPGDAFAHESPSTSHLSVVDAEGNAVSTTQTVNYGFGSGVVAQGTGVVLNDEMDDFSIKPGTPNVFGLVGKEANAVAAHKTMLSSMSPTLVLRPAARKPGSGASAARDELYMVVGSPGGPRIITATLQTIINVVDHKMSFADAVHAPRIHHQWLPDELRAEAGALTPETIEALTKMGHKVSVQGTIGDVQLVGVEPDGSLTGVSDLRSDGAPRGF